MAFNNPNGFVTDSLTPSPDRGILILEMGASNVPPGPWSDHVGGMVEVVIGFKVGKGEHIDLSTTKDISFHNSYAAYKSCQQISGSVDITMDDKDGATVLGKVVLESDDPGTYQVIELKDERFPVYSIEEYLEIERKDFLKVE